MHNISLEKHREITKTCIVCSFDKIVDLHHIDKNRKNNSDANLVGLCPNHHKLVHMYKHRKEILDLLRAKGYKIHQEVRSELQRS